MPTMDRNGPLVNHPQHLGYGRPHSCSWLPPAQGFWPSEPLDLPKSCVSVPAAELGQCAHCSVGSWRPHSTLQCAGSEHTSSPHSAQVSPSMADSWGSEDGVCTVTAPSLPNMPQRTHLAARSLKARRGFLKEQGLCRGTCPSSQGLPCRVPLRAPPATDGCCT